MIILVLQVSVARQLPMRAKTLALLFLVPLGVAAMVVLGEAAGREEILVATMPLAAGTLLRAPDVTWQAIDRPAEPGEIVRPSAADQEAPPKLDEEVRSEIYGAALRGAVAAGDPIRRGGIVKPGDRDFCSWCCRPASGQSQSPLPPAGPAPACYIPAIVST
jgi:Flp pilus assembly protein CpaB